MLKALKQIFTWWNGNTIGTRFFTWRKGALLGQDEFGNSYYEGPLHKDGYKRRWVIYKNFFEASTIPPGWHGWIHHRVDTPPSQENYQAYSWQKPHLPNQTGSINAYKPCKDSKVGSDYGAWQPKSTS